MKSNSESGNIVFFILLAVLLLGLVTAAIRQGGGEGANIDRETISIRISEIRQYANELERGVAFIMQDGASESELRFAHPDAPAGYGTVTDTPTRQVFGELGGGVTYRLPPSDISSGTSWEFYGHTHLPEVGTSAAELVAVLPDVNLAFCQKVNEMIGYDMSVQPTDNIGECINAADNDPNLRFSSANQFSTGAGVDTTNEATFSVKPSMQGCVQCGTDYHFFHVLMAR